MPVFYVDEEAIQPPQITIRGELARHLACSLRMQPGERCQFADGRRRYLGELTRVTPAAVTATILTDEPAAPPVRPVTLAQAVIKGHRMDWLLQKAAELGAARIIPITTSRTVVRPREERRDAQQRRWEKILREAGQQSGRSRPPELSPASDLRVALAQAPADAARLILWESETHALLSAHLSTLPSDQPIFLLIGPEGGLSAEEVAAATDRGFVSVSLGPLTLRAETATLAALAIIHGAARHD